MAAVAASAWVAFLPYQTITHGETAKREGRRRKETMERTRSDTFSKHVSVSTSIGAHHKRICVAQRVSPEREATSTLRTKCQGFSSRPDCSWSGLEEFVPSLKSAAFRSGASLHTSTQTKQKPKVYESPSQSHPTVWVFLCLTVVAGMVSCSRGDEKVFTDCGWLKFHFYPTVNPAAV